jgi:hypothetical protein
MGQEQLMSKELETNAAVLKSERINAQRFAVKYKSILAFFLLIIIFWVCFSIGESEWPHIISYAFHESFYIPVNIGLFLIPIVGIIMILGYLIKVTRKEDTRHNIVRFLFISVILITHIFLLRYVFSFVTISGYAVIDKKIINEDAHYIYVDHGEYSIRLRCTSEIYNQVVADENLAYRIEYKWSKLFPEKGKLNVIKSTDVIDNR